MIVKPIGKLCGLENEFVDEELYIPRFLRKPAAEVGVILFGLEAELSLKLAAQKVEAWTVRYVDRLA